MCVFPVQRGGKPLVGVSPTNRSALAEIDDMRAAAKSSKPGTRAGVGILEPPEAGEIEVFGNPCGKPPPKWMTKCLKPDTQNTLPHGNASQVAECVGTGGRM